MTEERKRGRPKKSEPKKTGELYAYLPEGVLADFRDAAEQRSVSMSTLVGQLITDFLYGKREQSVSAQDIAREVVRLLRQQDVSDDKLVPAPEEPHEPDWQGEKANGDGTENVQQKITSANSALEKINGAEFAPQMPNPAPRTEETGGHRRENISGERGDNVVPRTTRRRKVVRRTRPEGGGDGDT